MLVTVAASKAISFEPLEATGPNPSEPRAHGEIRAKKVDEPASDPDAWALSLGLQSEVRSIDTPLPQRRQVQGISGQEFSLIGEISRPQDGLNFSFELGSERIETQNEFLLTEALIHYSPLRSQFFSLIVGQQIIPYGLFSEQDRFLSAYPEPYSRILTWSRGIDVGVGMKVMPFGVPLFSVTGQTFAGQTHRAAEGRPGNPKEAPRLLNATLQHELYEARLTAFTHDLRFIDRIESKSASLRLGRYFSRPSNSWFQISGVAEIHEWDEIQNPGPRLRSRSLLWSTQIQVQFLALGYLEAQTQAALLDASQSSVAIDQLDTLRSSTAFVSAEPVSGLRIQFEKRQTRQGPLSLIDETAIRIVADLSRSFQL